MTNDDVMRAYICDELSKYARGDAARAYAAALRDDNHVRELCHILSLGRRNGVYDIVSRHKCWDTSHVPMSLIRVAEVNPAVNRLLEAHDFRLADIAIDTGVTGHHEFRGPPELSAESKRAFAVREGAGFRLFDGIHRAIRLAADGAETILLFYPKPVSRGVEWIDP